MSRGGVERGCEAKADRESDGELENMMEGMAGEAGD